MSQPQNTAISAFLHTHIPAADIRAQADHLGVIQRQRKTDLLALLAVILFTMPVRGRISRAAMWRDYVRRTGNALSRAAFYKRFTRPLAKLIRWILQTLIDHARAHPPRYTGVLEGFRDVIAADATTIALPPTLRDRWPGTNDGTAAIKVHTWIRALTGQLLKRRVTAGTADDGKNFGVMPSDQDCLFLLDRAYSAARLWRRINDVGAFFVTRLTASYKPTILRSLRSHRGRAKDVSGRKLREVLGEIEREVLDVACVFRAHTRKYGKKRGWWTKEVFRVVAVKNAESGAYHLYVTNLPAERWPAEEIGTLYKLRWEVELSYKAAKSDCGLAELNSTDATVVEMLVDAALIRETVAMQARLHAQDQLPDDRWINPLMWMRVWAEEFKGFIPVIAQVAYARIRVSFRTLARLAVAPDRKRVPLRYSVLRRPTQKPHI